MKPNLLITMSGGTTCVINATLAGVLKTVKESGKFGHVYTGTPGILGVLEDNIIEIPTDIRTIKLLQSTPASGFSGTTRISPLDKEEIYKLCNIFNKHNIQFFINIGGNGTIKQSCAISEWAKNIKIASLSKTVDNDLGDQEFVKVHYTPGFPSCAKYWRHKVLILNQENLGAYSHDKVIVAQTFGRETGFLAGAARLGDKNRELPLIILLPEDQRPIEEVVNYAKKVVERKNRAIIIMSEGYKIGDLGELKDKSGQIMYGSSKTSAAQLLVNILNSEGLQSRSFIPGIDQRVEIIHASVLDIKRSFLLGEYLVKQLLVGKYNFLASISKNSKSEMSYTSIPYKECQNYSRIVKNDWISKGHFDVTNQYINYLEPLIGTETMELDLSKEGTPNFVKSMLKI